MAIIDVCTYNGEKEILKLHFEILYPYVDRFIVCEAKTTFSGHKKPLYFSEHEQHFKKYWKKIRYYIIEDNFSYQEIQQAIDSPNTKGADHWRNEFLQKESIKKALIEYRVKNDDIVYIGDADEIWQPYKEKMPAKLKLKVYTYYLDNRSNEQFWGTLVAQYKDIKDNCLNHLRSNTKIRTEKEYGWHFTSMGGLEELQRKLNDSYTEESYNTKEVQQNLQNNIQDNKDFLGRDFVYKKDESDWPQYLKENKKKYQHMLTS